MVQPAKMCPWYARWWHRRQRRRDHLFIDSYGVIGVWRDNFRGNGPNHYNILNFKHWNCPCAAAPQEKETER